MSSENFFKRRAEIQIEGSGKRISSSSLSLSFSVSLEKGEPLNEAEIVLYNISETTIATLQGGAMVSLFCGYENTSQYGLLIKGEVEQVVPMKQGGNQLVKLSLSDGGNAKRNSRSSQSWGGTVSATGIIKELCQKTGLKYELEGLQDKKLESGFACHGSTLDSLKKLCNRIGAEYTIQNGILIVRDKKLESGSLILLSAESGLIGEPERVYEKNKPTKVKIQSLLLPSIRPNSRVQLQANKFKGTLNIEKVSHSGSTFGNDWFTTMEGVLRE